MTSKKIKILILTLIILLTAFFDFNLLNRYTSDIVLTKTESPPKQILNEGHKSKIINLVTLKINDKAYESNLNEKATVYDLMTLLQKEGKINFKEKTYTGMGKFIEEINGVKNGEKNWIYYVNNEKANIGISNYKIKSGDVVSWKYEASY